MFKSAVYHGNTFFGEMELYSRSSNTVHGSRKLGSPVSRLHILSPLVVSASRWSRSRHLLLTRRCFLCTPLASMKIRSLSIMPNKHFNKEFSWLLPRLPSGGYSKTETPVP